jgi:hypothetical protein
MCVQCSSNTFLPRPCASLFQSSYIIIIICDTYRALPRTHAVNALLPIRFSKKPSVQLPLDGLIVLKWHEMLWQFVPQSCCTNRKTPVTICTSCSVDMQLFAACGTGLPGPDRCLMHCLR